MEEQWVELGISGRFAGIHAGRRQLGGKRDAGLRHLRRRETLEPLLGWRGVARMASPRRRAHRKSNGVHLGSGPHRRVRAGRGRRAVAPVVRAQRLAAMGVARPGGLGPSCLLLGPRPERRLRARARWGPAPRSLRWQALVSRLSARAPVWTAIRA